MYFKEMYMYLFSREKFLEAEANVTVRGDEEGWLKFNVTRAADVWTLFPSSNLGLYMRVTNAKGEQPRT